METRAERQRRRPDSPHRHETRRAVYNGVAVDVTEFWGAGEVESDMAYDGQTRLTALLNETGAAPCEPRVRRGQPCPEDYRPRNVQFVPAGTRLWGYCADADYIRDVTFAFIGSALEERLGEPFQLHRRAPRLRFADDRIWGPMKLLAEAIESGEPVEPLWADHLVLAVIARLEGLAFDPMAQRGLAPWRLRRALALIEARSPERVSLEELAADVGLSQAHFARAFKASTGLAPYQWQMQARIRQAKAMLERGDETIDAIAHATGFADAGHFARRFRNLVGVSPAAWRRDRRA